jgi:hypothetical protein
LSAQRQKVFVIVNDIYFHLVCPPALDTVSQGHTNARRFQNVPERIASSA